MPTQNKHGRYEVFDWRAASWACPSCRKDALKISDEFAPLLIFKCNACDFDSKKYGIAMTPKSTFNSVHRWLMREWKWIQYITDKFYMDGVDDALLLTKGDEEECACCCDN